ncbi:hypothetical protein [Paraburkholderia ferrariae]|uniref:Uncharacterized protein n=1 Tax=Paraburkholderia ferrariae TaxID=386056 RepID=A0ABU9RNT1_9BURK
MNEKGHDTRRTSLARISEAASHLLSEVELSIAEGSLEHEALMPADVLPGLHWVTLIDFSGRTSVALMRIERTVDTPDSNGWIARRVTATLAVKCEVDKLGNLRTYRIEPL